MDGQVTSPQSPATWRRFGAFLRRPSLPRRPTGLSRAALAPLAWLFALDLLLMTAIIGAIGALVALGVKLPTHMLGELEITPFLLAFILVGAPVGEELAFRSWLSGRPGHVGAVLVVVATALAAWAAPADPLALLAIVAAGVALFGLALWRGRGREPMAFFARRFGWFYVFSAVAFAAIHLTNFTEGSAPVLLPLVLPQFLLGLILGYARVTYGLWSCVLLHAAHNALFVSLIMAGTG